MTEFIVTAVGVVHPGRGRDADPALHRGAAATAAVRRAAAVTGIDLVDATLIIGGVGLMVLWIIVLAMR